jgi:hypothetical protein
VWRTILPRFFAQDLRKFSRERSFRVRCTFNNPHESALLESVQMVKQRLTGLGRCVCTGSVSIG